MKGKRCGQRFSRWTSLLMAAGCVVLLGASVRAYALMQTTTRVSVASNGTQGSNETWLASINDGVVSTKPGLMHQGQPVGL